MSEEQRGEAMSLAPALQWTRPWSGATETQWATPLLLHVPRLRCPKMDP